MGQKCQVGRVQGLGWSEEAALGGDIEQKYKGGEDAYVCCPEDVLINIKKKPKPLTHLQGCIPLLGTLSQSQLLS